jgi:hypothetical protein
MSSKEAEYTYNLEPKANGGWQFYRQTWDFENEETWFAGQKQNIRSFHDYHQALDFAGTVAEFEKATLIVVTEEFDCITHNFMTGEYRYMPWGTYGGWDVGRREQDILLSRA